MKMKVYKNFDEITGKVEKTTMKILQIFKKKNWSVSNIDEISKIVAIFKKI